MVNAILGKKLGMTQVYNDQGRVIAVSVIQAGPCVITQTRTDEKDGYSALQLGFEDVQENRLTKPVAGQFAKTKVAPKRYLREIRVEPDSALEVGQEVKADLFAAGDTVIVTGISKGKGFAGAVKRWHFHGGDMTHGSMIHRKPQSGGATDAARTFKGVKRPGRMGGKRVSTRGLKVIRADAERNLLLIRGSVPGANGGLVLIKKTGKGE
ncbi:MAG: 50S ribosomal protein L3 [Armatimonadota bacterium]|nr:50S ribosomal protein L3 [Armatimonadota bacterium]